METYKIDHIADTSSAPTRQAIEFQRQRQLAALRHVRRMLAGSIRQGQEAAGQVRAA